MRAGGMERGKQPSYRGCDGALLLSGILSPQKMGGDSPFEEGGNPTMGHLRPSAL